MRFLETHPGTNGMRNKPERDTKCGAGSEEQRRATRCSFQPHVLHFDVGRFAPEPNAVTSQIQRALLFSGLLLAMV